MYGPSHRLFNFLTGRLQPATAARYEARLTAFDDWARVVSLDWRAMDEESLDFALCDFILDGRDSHHRPQAYSEAVAAVAKAFGNRRRFPTAHRCLDAWRADEPPTQAPPVPEAVCYALVFVIHVCASPSEALALLLGFVGLLRIGEALALRASDVIFSLTDDNRQAAVLILRRTKRGAPMSERVVLTNSRIVCYLRRFLVTENLKGEDLLCRTSYSRVARALAQGAAVLNISGMELRTHSFRRGGATALAMRGVAFADIMLIGRWASERSCKLYIQRGELLILKYHSTLSTNQSLLINKLATYGEHAFAARSLAQFAAAKERRPHG